jgi:hypothetical protein
VIKIAIAAALAALIVCDVTILPASTGVTETIERPRGHKGDRLPVQPTGADCTDAAWPYYQGDCVGGRQQPGEQAPAARTVRIVATDRKPAGNPALSFAN